MTDVPLLFGMTIQFWLFLLTMLSMIWITVLIIVGKKQTGNFHDVENISVQMLEDCRGDLLDDDELDNEPFS